MIKKYTRDKKVKTQVLGPILGMFSNELAKILPAYRSGEAFKLSYTWCQRVGWLVLLLFRYLFLHVSVAQLYFHREDGGERERR